MSFFYIQFFVFVIFSSCSEEKARKKKTTSLQPEFSNSEDANVGIDSDLDEKKYSIKGLKVEKEELELTSGGNYSSYQIKFEPGSDEEYYSWQVFNDKSEVVDKGSSIKSSDKTQSIDLCIASEGSYSVSVKPCMDSECFKETTLAFQASLGDLTEEQKETLKNKCTSKNTLDKSATKVAPVFIEEVDINAPVKLVAADLADANGSVIEDFENKNSVSDKTIIGSSVASALLVIAIIGAVVLSVHIKKNHEKKEKQKRGQAEDITKGDDGSGGESKAKAGGGKGSSSGTGAASTRRSGSISGGSRPRPLTSEGISEEEARLVDDYYNSLKTYLKHAAEFSLFLLNSKNSNIQTTVDPNE